MAITRKTQYTEASSHKQRLEIWQNAVAATHHHIQKGKDLQVQGESIINQLDTLETTAEQAIKFLQQATTILEKGIKIERESYDKLAELHRHEPK